MILELKRLFRILKESKHCSHKMKISGFLKQTVKDFPPEKLTIAVFTSGCNYSCPSCHAKHINNGGQNYTVDDVFSYLDKTKGFIEGVVICGGEPTLQKDLPDFARKCKEKGLLVKLDTNGSNPEMLERLLNEKIIDYVAMDIKGPSKLYSKLIGKESYSINEGIALVQKFPDYEFRTTVAPVILADGISFMTPEEAGEMAKEISSIADKNSKWYIQKFVARSKKEMMDERLSKENLAEEIWETPNELLKSFSDEVKKYFPKCELR
ncbi:anaerobic ribonucleoside-triphosphate reductase activating protein [Candidatus Pacearchaeota archaeon CG06_land_8_20_14_3_00_35_12]|nr:MAG: anaerobic ribonucleoside-triphosphate reductase activating protein [Candidatus Pacearchaeota archaeon CG06_land_8_20_14_3_00_35_12]